MRALPSEVWRLGDALEPLEKLVVLALLDYGARAHPRQQVLAVKTGLSRRTLQRVLDSLRVKGVVETRARGKALTYVVDLSAGRRQADAGIGVRLTQGSEPAQGTSPPNPGAAGAATGWGGVPPDVVEAIRQRDAAADRVVSAQRRVCALELVSHGIGDARAQDDAWRLLCHAWAKAGRRPLDTVRAVTDRLDGARDPSAVVLHRLRGAA